MREKGFAPLVILVTVAILSVLGLLGFFAFQNPQGKPKPRTELILQQPTQEPQTTLSLSTNLRADSVLSITSNGKYWLLSYPCDGLYKYEEGKTTKIPRPSDESDSWVNNIEWNGKYWLFSSKDVYTCIKDEIRKASLQVFDGINFTDHTKSFDSSSECKVDKISSLSWNGKRWLILSRTFLDPKTTQACVVAFDGQNFVDLTAFLRKNLDLTNFSFGSLNCNVSFCVATLQSKREDELAFFKLNFEEASVESIKSSNFADYSAFARSVKYVDIVGSNETSLILKLNYQFLEADSRKLNASTITELYEYDGKRAQLLYKYSSPYLPKDTPVEDVVKAFEGLFEPEKAVWDPFQKKWFIVGFTSIRGNVENELVILEVTKDYKTEQLKYNPPIINKATDVGNIAVTEEGILIEEPFTKIILIKFQN